MKLITMMMSIDYWTLFQIQWWLWYSGKGKNCCRLCAGVTFKQDVGVWRVSSRANSSAPLACWGLKGLLLRFTMSLLFHCMTSCKVVSLAYLPRLTATAWLEVCLWPFYSDRFPAIYTENFSAFNVYCCMGEGENCTKVLSALRLLAACHENFCRISFLVCLTLMSFGLVMNHSIKNFKKPSSLPFSLLCPQPTFRPC